MKVLGVSGSPIPNSNTDRALKKVLEGTGLETEFIKLKDYTLSPCNACLGCVETNRCVIEDDGRLLAEKTKEADAIIIAAYAPYSSIDARSKAYLERLYQFRHKSGILRGKPGAAVVTHAIPEGDKTMPPAADMVVNAIKYYMMEEGLNFVGAVKLIGNVPCVRCGISEECRNSGLKMIFGPEATVESVGINSIEDYSGSIEALCRLGNKLREALISRQ